MYQKDLNFKSVVFKVFVTYLIIYLFALLLRYNYDIEPFLNSIQYKYLIVFNILSIFSGLPFSIIFDFILIKVFGFYYVLFFSPVLTILSVIQVIILRKINIKVFRGFLFFKKTKKNYFFKLFENVTFRSVYVLVLRAFPILPHILGSYIIASSKIKKRVILINTFIGSLFYYIFLFLIIANV